MPQYEKHPRSNLGALPLPQIRHPGTHKYRESWGSVFHIQSMTLRNISHYYDEVYRYYDEEVI